MTTNWHKHTQFPNLVLDARKVINDRANAKERQIHPGTVKPEKNNNFIERRGHDKKVCGSKKPNIIPDNPDPQKYTNVAKAVVIGGAILLVLAIYAPGISNLTVNLR